MQVLQQLASRMYYGNSLGHYAEALAIFLVLLMVLPLLRLALSRRLRSLKLHESPTALELTIALVAHTTRLFIVAVSAYASLKSLRLPARADHIIDVLIEIATWIQVALWGMQAAVFAIDRHRRRTGATAQLPTYAILRFVSLVLVWALSLLMLLANLGVNITALVTSLGIGGVAFALAIQNVLGDILASLAIAWDKPFELGDELHLGELIGTVEQIGIKSTRLRSIDGDQIIIGNSQLLTQQIRNFGRAREQRIALVLTLAFDIPHDALRAFPALVEQAVRTLPVARFDRCWLRGLGAAGFEFELSVFDMAPTRTLAGALREQLLFAVVDKLAAGGLGFASAGSPVLSLAKKPEAAGAAAVPSGPASP
ncbi:MAG TPA: mechanosensitive ion channel domain-containing protein [Steroidobacteraceae bacterium]|jgi:small-conductance mechanosensitive channel|nr:mechanosensitive ion channel domain-containing protein [Steroidobacteraceae bacterium]